MSVTIPVVPALIPESLEHARATIEKLTFSNEIQLDLVDGDFVPTRSWPYRPNDEPFDLKPLLDKFTLEVDLMVADPLVAAHNWVQVGADMIIFHVETLSLDQLKTFAANCDCSVGVAAHGATTVDTIADYARQADYIQLMGIREIGAQGQPFDETVLDRVQALRALFPDMMISVDGSVNQDTIQKLKRVGVNRMVVGSAIVGQADPQAAHTHLSALIN